MRVFVTGGTGFVGTAVVRELLDSGYQVVGLARSAESVNQLTVAGARVQRGSLEDIGSLTQGAAQADGVIHLAFNHDFSDFAASCEKDQAAIEVLGHALAGSERPLIVTSGVLGLAQGRAGTEEDVPPDTFPRKSEATALGFASKGVRASVVRLSPSVHGEGDRGFVPQLIQSARTQGSAFYIGNGSNRWPAVHRLDVARLYRLVLEKGAAGLRYHGVAEEGIPIRDIAECIGKRLGVPAVSRSAAEARNVLGHLGRVLEVDAPSSSRLTQERLEWRPVNAALLTDLKQGTYFDAK